MKNRLLSLGFLLILLFTVGCKPVMQTEVMQSGDSDTVKIGFSIDSLVVERWERDRDVFVTKAKELGAEVNIQNASGDVSTQEKQLRYLISKGVDVLVIVAADSNAFYDEVEEAHKKGIKVIAYDRLLVNSNADLYISFDNAMVGTLMAESLTDKVLVGDNIMMVNGSTTDNNVALVSEGFKRVAYDERWNITDVTYIDGWKQELAYDYINENIDAVKNVSAIMCGNDAIAGQVIKALSENRIAGNIPVVGQDADLDACQRIVEGSQFMTVYKPIDILAETAAEYSVKLAKEGISEELETINDGTYNVPCLYITPYAVTGENIDEMIIESGFHMRSEVYLKVK